MKTTNNIRFTANRIGKKGVQYKINIRLNDECKNGHNDFSITGESWEANKPKSDRYSLGCGAMGDTIAKEFPEYAIFNNLHLCDVKGAPMHASANGFYHLKTDKMEKSKFCEYYRVSTEQYNVLIDSEDEQHFKYLLYNVGVVKQWQEEAEKAIKLLEEMSGLKFKDDSVRFQLEPFTDSELAEMINRTKNGYYSADKIKERKDKSQADKKEKLLTDLKTRFDAKHLEAIQNYELDKIAIELFLTTSNIIFYNSRNTIVFNWQSGTYGKQYTESDFEQFKAVAQQNKYLKDCVFELKINK